MSCELVKNTLQKFLSQLAQKTSKKEPQLFIGLSGGLDSIVLTHVLNSIEHDWTIQAVYIDHGLSHQAQDWAAFCQHFCQQNNILYQAKSIRIETKKRRGLEDSARQLRYQALLSLMGEGDVLLTAHHQQDLVETSLMNFFRGAGVTGLAAIPAFKSLSVDDKTVLHARPLLALTKQELRQYAIMHQLEWVEDPSNQQLEYHRNFVRHEILPKIHQAWPKADKRIAASAGYFSEALELLDELAIIDLAECKSSGFSLDMTAVEGLSWSRQKNLLRYWGQNSLSIRFTEALYEWLELALSSENAQAHWLKKTREGDFRVEGKKVFYLKDFLSIFEKEYSTVGDLTALHFDERSLLTHQIAPDFLSSPNRVVIRSISMDEISQFPELKKWLKQNRVVFWNRDRWPVIEINGELAAILGFKTFSNFKLNR